MTLVTESQDMIEREIDAYRQEVETLERQAASLLVTDDASEEAALLFIAECKRAYAKLEERRDSKVRPLNAEVKAINEGFRPYTTVLDRLWRTTDQIRGRYVTQKQQAIEAANRRAIADAAELRRQEEAKADAARQEAERLRLDAERLVEEENNRLLQVEMDRLAAEQNIKDEEEALARAKREGDARAAREAQEAIDQANLEEEERLRKAELDRLAAIEEQNKLEKKAIKLDAKADIAESHATMIAPTIQVDESAGSRTLMDGSQVGTRKAVDWLFENGMPKDGDYYADDPRLLGIPARYFILDTAKLGKDVKNGVPVPGTIRTVGSATTARRK
jgi:hypothetical protein